MFPQCLKSMVFFTGVEALVISRFSCQLELPVKTRARLGCKRLFWAFSCAMVSYIHCTPRTVCVCVCVCVRACVHARDMHPSARCLVSAAILRSGLVVCTHLYTITRMCCIGSKIGKTCVGL